MFNIGINVGLGTGKTFLLCCSSKYNIDLVVTSNHARWYIYIYIYIQVALLTLLASATAPWFACEQYHAPCLMPVIWHPPCQAALGFLSEHILSNLSARQRKSLTLVLLLSQGLCAKQAESTRCLSLWSNYSQCLLVGVALSLTIGHHR